MLWPTLLGLVIAANLYLLATRRLARRGVRWSTLRTLAHASGIATIAIAMAPPLATHDEDIRVHMVQHLMLGMLGPLLLALSAPGTLFLRVLPPRRRAPVVRVLHSRVARVFLHPFSAVLLVLGSVYALYFTELYAATLRSEPLHLVVHLHMLVAGCLLAWSLVGLDPVPYRPAFRLRSTALIIAIAAHTVLAKLLYAHAGSLAGERTSPDTWRQGAQVLFYGGDLVDLALLTALFAQWYVREGHRAERLRAAG
ncbi:MAG: putative rane protein [Actinomycetota bacterium]|jgi:putative membrane protein|nr:putative rane protein [Actinomycetota bacterium]